MKGWNKAGFILLIVAGIATVVTILVAPHMVWEEKPDLSNIYTILFFVFLSIAAMSFVIALFCFRWALFSKYESDKYYY